MIVFGAAPCQYFGMPDALEKAARFISRAEECLRLADQTRDKEFRAHYLNIAGCYMALAEAETAFAERQKLFLAAGGKW